MSADNVDDSFFERSRIESGLMIGPRIFSVGSIIYGAAINELHPRDCQHGRGCFGTEKDQPGSISYKNCNIPSRFVRIINLNKR